MMATNGEAALATVPQQQPTGEGTIAAFASQSAFETAQRMAIALSKSTIMPSAYQGNVPNCMLALEMASRMNASVLMVAQNLDIIQGKPSLSAKFLIATVNASKRFTPIRYRWQGAEHSDDWGCRAVAKDLASGEDCVGPLVTVRIAKAEEWAQRKGSKWRTLPELMLMYRAAAFWARVYCPELSLGLHTTEEVIDTVGYTVSEPTRAAGAPVPGASRDLEAELMADVIDVPPAAKSEPKAVAHEEEVES
jgi:hypothetical protein